MTTITIVCPVSDGTLNITVNTTASTDVLTATATVVPDPAPAGTTRTLTVKATSAAGLPITYGTPTSAGITFTAVSGSPGKWTFKY